MSASGNKNDLPTHRVSSRDSRWPLPLRTSRLGILWGLSLLTVLIVVLKFDLLDILILPRSATQEGIHLPKRYPAWVMNPSRLVDGGPDPVPDTPVFDTAHPTPPLRHAGMAVPDIMHYVWFSNTPDGEEGERTEMAYWQYLALKSALVRQDPALVYMHCNVEPDGPWWPLIKRDPRVVIMPIELPSFIYGREVHMGMHKTDILRMLILKHYGGIYLDTDIFVVKPLDELMYADMTMAHQAPNGLCNAIEISAPNSLFMDRWIDSYRDFDHIQWYHNSVYRPFELAVKYPDEIQVIDEKYAFWPSYYDDAVYRNADYDFFATGQFFYHGWHHSNREHLDNVSPRDVLDRDTSFNLLIRDLVSEDDLAIWSSH